MFETTVREGACRLGRSGARWLATGWNGGYVDADGAVVLTVPIDFDRTDLDRYVAQRRDRAGFAGDGPTLLTGVDVAHARGARCDSVTVVATAGLSNPASLPVHSSPAESPTDDTTTDSGSDAPPRPGTVNLLVGTTSGLDDGTLATLLSTAVEAKTATLSAVTGFTGTTSDAVAVGCDPAGDPADFAGSGTALGAATRACVRDAILASLSARYDDAEIPASVDDAEHGTVTTTNARTFRP